eukprot:8201070-Ditylum_brightwellii.AAC.1
MEHQLRHLKSTLNNSVRVTMSEAISKLNLKCNNTTIKNVKQYREYCKHFLMTALNIQEVKAFFKHTHFAVTVAAFDYKPFWYKQVLMELLEKTTWTSNIQNITKAITFEASHHLKKIYPSKMP